MVKRPHISIGYLHIDSIFSFTIDISHNKPTKLNVSDILVSVSYLKEELKMRYLFCGQFSSWHSTRRTRQHDTNGITFL